MARMKLNPDERTRWEKVMGVKKTKARIPKYGTSKPTKISQDRRTSSQRLADSVRAKEYKKVKGEAEERSVALPMQHKKASIMPDWAEEQIERGYQRTANREAGSAVTKAEKAATARRRKRLADLKKRGVKPSNKFDLE